MVRRCWVNFQFPGVLLIRIIVGQGPVALAAGAGRVVWTFFLSSIISRFFPPSQGWSDGAMVLGKLPVPGRPTIWITVGQGPTTLAVGADRGCFDIFNFHLSFLSSFFLSLGDGPI